MTPKEFIGDKAVYNNMGQMVLAQKGNDMQLLLVVRGWGAIQNIFKSDMEAAENFQDELGKWVTAAINEKMERETANTAAPEKERFKKPDDEQMLGLAVLVNDGNLDTEKLTDMLTMSKIIVDRLHENGDITIPSSNEQNG